MWGVKQGTGLGAEALQKAIRCANTDAGVAGPVCLKIYMQASPWRTNLSISDQGASCFSPKLCVQVCTSMGAYMRNPQSRQACPACCLSTCSRCVRFLESESLPRPLGPESIWAGEGQQHFLCLSYFPQRQQKNPSCRQEWVFFLVYFLQWIPKFYLRRSQ